MGHLQAQQVLTHTQHVELCAVINPAASMMSQKGEVWVVLKTMVLAAIGGGELCGKLGAAAVAARSIGEVGRLATWSLLLVRIKK